MSATIDLYLHKCNPNAKMRSVRATNRNATISLQWLSKMAFLVIDVVFVCLFVCFSLQEMLFKCDILQESMSGVMLMSDF